MKTYCTVHRIVNHSSTAVHYSWRQYATTDEEGITAVTGTINRPSQGSTHLEGLDTENLDIQPAGVYRQ